MASDIDLRLGLGKVVRQTLQTLRDNDRLTNRTQLRLTTGKKINSVVDGAIDFFRSEALIDRVEIFKRRSQEIDQAISALEAHNTAIDGLSEFVDQLRAQITSARSETTDTGKVALSENFKEIGTQILLLVNDVDYNGLNLLASDQSSLIVRFSDVEASRVEIAGIEVLGSAISTGALFSDSGVFNITGAEFFYTAFGVGGSNVFEGFSNISNNNISQLDILYEKLDLADIRLNNFTRNFGNRVSLLQARNDFLNEYTTGLLVGSEKISVADLNEEAANSKALELQHEIALNSISNSQRTQQLLLQIISGR